ncbi:MAG TPA: F0F1 ATP synthase subunit A [Steroidobacteraceae bacterium]|nr:F0F1 ATP synthase subunit A [Steroidobacteraceae bacterium]
MNQDDLQAAVLWQFGPLQISATILTTWCITALLAAGCWLLTRRLREQPGTLQTMVEGVVGAIEQAIGDAVPGATALLLPFIGTLWIFLVAANLSGLIPGVHAPTRDLSTTAALALVVFFSTHWFGIRDQGVKGYLRHYLEPTPLMLPMTLISEITRTIALAVRLFGNMMSLEMTALLVLVVAGFLAPIPILMLHIIEALVQAWIFGMLAMLYIAGGIRARRQDNTNQTEGVSHA